MMRPSNGEARVVVKGLVPTPQPQFSSNDPSVKDFRTLLRALVANGLATWFNDPFSAMVNPGSTTTVQLTVQPQQTVLITEMRAYAGVSHALSLTIQSEGYTFWNDPAMVSSLYTTPVDFIEQMMNFPSTQTINFTLSNSLEAPVTASFFLFGLTMDTNVWESIQQTYFDGVIESAIGSE